MSILCNFFSLVAAQCFSFAKHTGSDSGLLGKSRGCYSREVTLVSSAQKRRLERRRCCISIVLRAVIELIRFGDDRKTACL